MELKSMFFILLFVALCFATVGFLVGDFRTYYPEAGAVNSSWEYKYNFVFNAPNNLSSVNETMSSLDYWIQKSGSAEGWWDRLTSSVMVIYQGAIQSALAVMKSPAYALSMLSSVERDFGVPQMVIMILNVFIIAGVIFAIVEFIHRYRT